MSLKGKVAVVSGGGSGLGRACSLQLARDGAAIAVWDLNEEGANETVSMIADAGGRGIVCAGDAADQRDIARHAARTREELGPVTILVNNAGITGFQKFEELTEDTLTRMFRINAIGPFLCAGSPGHAERRLGTHHQYLVFVGPDRRRHNDPLFRFQGSGDRLHQIPRAGAGRKGDYRQQHSTGVRRYTDAARLARGPRATVGNLAHEAPRQAGGHRRRVLLSRFRGSRLCDGTDPGRERRPRHILKTQPNPGVDAKKAGAHPPAFLLIRGRRDDYSTINPSRSPCCRQSASNCSNASQPGP